MKILYKINYAVQVEIVKQNVSTIKYYPITCVLKEVSAIHILQEIERVLGRTFGESYKILSFREVLTPIKIYSYDCHLIVSKNGVTQDYPMGVNFSDETELTFEQLREKAIEHLKGGYYELVSINILP